MRRAILDALAKGSHPAAQPLFERLAGAPDARASDQAFTLRFFAANGQYPRAYRWIEQNLMNLLLPLEPNDQQFLIQAVAEVQRGDSYEDGRARWRSDPHAAATWPELALSLYWYQVHSFGADHALVFDDAFDAIPLTDFRSRPTLTLARAVGYDEAVQAWALAELAQPPPAAPPGGENDARGEADNPALLPLQVLAIAWKSEHVGVLERVFCQGGSRRAALLWALGLSGDELYEDLLAKIATTPGLSDDERDLVVRAATGFAMRAARERGVMRWSGLGREDALLGALLRGQPAAVAGLTCPR